MVNVYIDLGTTNLKICCYKESNNIKNLNIKNKELYFDNKNYFDPDKLFNYLDILLDELIKELKENLNIYFSSAMHTLIFIDKSGKFISKGFSLLDSTEIKINQEDFSNNRKINGLVNSEFLPIYKIKTFGNQFNYEKILTLKSYILFKYINEYFIEVSDAAGLGLLNYKTKKYDSNLLSYSNISIKALPDILNENHFFKFSKNGFTINLSLGTSDGAAAALGSIENENDLSLSLGTTLGIRCISNSSIELKTEFDYCFPIYGEKYIYGISSSNAGNVIEVIYNKLKLDLSKIKYDINFIPDLKNQIYLFKERYPINFELTKQEALTEKIFYDFLYQLPLRIFEFVSILKKSLVNKKRVLASGGVFQNPIVFNEIKRIFNNDIIILKEINFSIEGLKRIDKNHD